MENKLQTVRRTIRTRRMRVFEEDELKKKECNEIEKVIKRESNIDNALGMYNDRFKALLYRLFPEVEERVTGRM